MMRIFDDRRVVLTLDAGGTKFAFNAMRGGRLLLEPLALPSLADDLAASLGQLRKGFDAVFEATGREAAALSFAFPGPADYRSGIIGELVNLPGFEGALALGPMLEDRYRLPVFINNDGDLFAYGEALGGLLPWVNQRLAEAGDPRRFRNLIGFTLGTGLGGGIVHDGKLLIGDNSAAAEVALLRHRDQPRSFAEEGVSIRAVRREYARSAGLPVEAAPEPREIAAIARGEAPGNANAALATYRRMGAVAGDAIAEVLTMVDGLVVLGGGLADAAPLFMPALLEELNGSLVALDGKTRPRLELSVSDLDDRSGLDAFLRSTTRAVPVPGSTRTVSYDAQKRTGIGRTRLGTSAAVSLGAYAFALDQLDRP
jgi:glucokinase